MTEQRPLGVTGGCGEGEPEVAFPWTWKGDTLTVGVEGRGSAWSLPFTRWMQYQPVLVPGGWDEEEMLLRMRVLSRCLAQSVEEEEGISLWPDLRTWGRKNTVTYLGGVPGCGKQGGRRLTCLYPGGLHPSHSYIYVDSTRHMRF